MRESWEAHVKTQAAKGGGSLFKYISRFDKQFLNVDWSITKGNNESPTLFLADQKQKWEAFWNPSVSESVRTQLIGDFSDFR